MFQRIDNSDESFKTTYDNDYYLRLAHTPTAKF